GTPITMGASCAEGTLDLWVADHGPGVPEDQRARVFDRFYRLEHHETERHGTGMGLAISRGLVEGHGGRLWVEDTPGGGATFRVSIPTAVSDQRSAVREGASDMRNEDTAVVRERANRSL